MTINSTLPTKNPADSVGNSEPSEEDYVTSFDRANRNLGPKNKKSSIPFLGDLIGVDWVSFNTHVGAGFRNGGFDWIVDKWDPEIVFCQEVKNVNLDRYKKDYHVIWHGTNAIFAKKKVFHLVESGGPDIRFGSQYARNRVYAILLHRELKRAFYVQDVHLDPLWGNPNISEIRDKGRLDAHLKQGNTYIDWQSKHRNARGAVHGDGGDFNEFVQTGHLTKKPTFLAMSMAYKYGRLQMFGAASQTKDKTGPVRIDEIFFKTSWFFSVTKRTSVDLRKKIKGLDHNTVLVRTMVRKRRRWSKDAQKMMSKN